MPKAKSNLSRTARGGRDARKRSKEAEELRARAVQLEEQLDAANEELKRVQGGVAIVLGGLTGRHRRRRVTPPLSSFLGCL